MQSSLVLLTFALLLVEISHAGTYEDPTQNNSTSSSEGSGANCDYCSIACDGTPNTRCGKFLVRQRRRKIWLQIDFNHDFESFKKGELSDNCPPTAHLCQMTDPMRQYILDQLNTNRNIIASGSNPNLTESVEHAKTGKLLNRTQKPLFVWSFLPIFHSNDFFLFSVMGLRSRNDVRY